MKKKTLKNLVLVGLVAIPSIIALVLGLNFYNLKRDFKEYIELNERRATQDSNWIDYEIYLSSKYGTILYPILEDIEEFNSDTNVRVNGLTDNETWERIRKRLYDLSEEQKKIAEKNFGELDWENIKEKTWHY